MLRYKLALIIIIILTTITTITMPKTSLKVVSNEINNNVNTVTNEYIAILEIPAIKLKRGFYNYDNKANNVNKNIMLLKESTFPTEDNSNIILASHSGNSKISYFKNLNKLELNSELYIYYQDIKYIYELIDIYKVDKTGYINLPVKEGHYVTLLTCDKKDKTKQVIYSYKQIKSINNY